MKNSLLQLVFEFEENENLYSSDEKSLIRKEIKKEIRLEIAKLSSKSSEMV